MTNVVNEHVCFTLTSVKNKVSAQLLKYDMYGKANDAATIEFLLTSLDPGLEEDIRDKLLDTDPFPVVWLTLITKVTSQGIEQFEALKIKICSIKSLPSTLVKTLKKWSQSTRSWHASSLWLVSTTIT
jgi:hypothetical protein